MNIYIDESGSFNNHSNRAKYFVIAMVRPLKKEALKRAYKRFVAKNYDTLKELDKDKIDERTGKTLKPGGKMFVNGRFKELKGSQFDPQMKRSFVEFFSQTKLFEVYYIIVSNQDLSDKYCENTARAFNYTSKAILYSHKKHDKDCHLLTNSVLGVIIYMPTVSPMLVPFSR